MRSVRGHLDAYQPPVEIPSSSSIGARERRAAGRRRPEMRQLALETRQAAADLAQRMRPPELGKQHRHELIPAGEAAGMPRGVRGLYGALNPCFLYG